MSFILTNIPDRVTMLPNETTKAKVNLGYKDMRTKYIDFVKNYNVAKTAGAITLNANEMDALRKLNDMWKSATAESKFFFEMEELHDQLNDKFLDASQDDVSAAWSDYVKVYSDWLGMLVMSSATMFEVKL
ncbi:uncharacterized protein LOC119071052 [Bradysia coprophila]|uniref:uncharacterized protein LOC119071052 n=1 Tax=Bradysia coprophila TaxID=38358 RepID=UPI00187D8C33|nr:uncharacterized protein LOC119071052 [Bradysia coprophila]XP_037031564.1 uncharacterized protein LOC119071052 [Bradysia coprophila]